MDKQLLEQDFYRWVKASETYISDYEHAIYHEGNYKVNGIFYLDGDGEYQFYSKGVSLTITKKQLKFVSIIRKVESEIAGATSSSTVKELEREVDSWKKEYDAMRLDNFRQSKEIQRLKGLVEKALKTVFIWKQDTDLSDAAWNKFKTENNL